MYCGSKVRAGSPAGSRRSLWKVPQLLLYFICYWLQWTFILHQGFRLQKCDQGATWTAGSISVEGGGGIPACFRFPATHLSLSFLENLHNTSILLSLLQLQHHIFYLWPRKLKEKLPIWPTVKIFFFLIKETSTEKHSWYSWALLVWGCNLWPQLLFYFETELIFIKKRFYIESSTDIKGEWGT